MASRLLPDNPWAVNEHDVRSSELTLLIDLLTSRLAQAISNANAQSVMFNNTSAVEMEFASESGTAVYTSAANSINAYTESVVKVATDGRGQRSEPTEDEPDAGLVEAGSHGEFLTREMSEKIIRARMQASNTWLL